MQHKIKEKSKFLVIIKKINQPILINTKIIILVVIFLININNNNRRSFCIYINEVNDLSNLHYSYFNCLNLKFLDISKLIKIENFKNKIDKFLLKAKNSKVENILILIGLFPFLNKNSTIYFITKTKTSYQIFKNLLKESINHKHNIIKLKKNDLFFLSNNFKYLLNYYWELIPSLSILNNIRYIINNYFSQNNLYIYERAVNLNLKKYISKKNSTFSYKYIKELMSK